MAEHSSNSASSFSSLVILLLSFTSALGASFGMLAASSASRASLSFRSSSSISATKSSSRGVSSGSAPAPRGSEAQSTSSSFGSSLISLVRIRPVATPVPNVPSVSASKAPIARAHLSLEGESTMNAGRSVSNTSNAAAKPGWHVASTHEKTRGPPALFLRILVSISKWASLFVLSGPPSSSAIAQRPPFFSHSSSKLDALSSGKGPNSFLLLGASCFGMPVLASSRFLPSTS
mmetsp:Transcript_10885/g.23081  ORF Transcript_10885/g.23081 Transcript_10885/m.23081 type:complete len:233 (-) Transcript_10885:1528-2226(-)